MSTRPATPPEAVERYRLGVVQLEIRTRRADDNRRRAAQLVARCAAAGCALVVLPEAFQTGLDLPRASTLAEPIPGPGSEWLSHLARTHGVHLAGGLLEGSGDQVFSSIVLVDDRGRLLTVYRKNFLVVEERPFLTPGREVAPVVATSLGRLGLLAGYDIHFPEVSRPLFAQGVDLLIYSAQLLRPFARSIRIMALSRSAESSCHLALASATGENTLAQLTFMGGSLILQSPVGVRRFGDELYGRQPVLAEAGVAEEILTAEIELAQQARLHAADPLYRDLQTSRFVSADA